MMRVFERIFGDRLGKAFLRDYWPHKAFNSRGSPRRFEDISEGALARLMDDFRVLPELLPHQSIEVFDNVVGSPAYFVSAAEAHEAYHEGMTIRLRRIDLSMPEIKRWLNAARDRVSSHTHVRRCYANLLISPQGWQCVPHFDGHEVLVLNLFGSKEWSYSPNNSVAHPCIGFELGNGTANIGQLGEPAGPLPQAMPRDAKTVRLRPGDSLFLPRGFFHCTRAITPSMQVTFSLETYTAAEHVTEGIFRGLLRTPQWREMPTKVFQPRTGRGVEPVEVLLNDLKEYIDRLIAERRFEQFGFDMFSAMKERPAPCFVRNPYLSIDVQGSGNFRMLVARGDTRTESIRLSRTATPLAFWLTARDKPFRLEDAVKRSNGLSKAQTSRIIRHWCERRLVWAASDG